MAEESKPPTIGPVGAQVVANIEELRRARGLSLAGLSEKLASIGVRIHANVLHRQSQGKRRIDVDDLVALSLALAVNPSALLFDRRAVGRTPVALTPVVQRPAWLVWAWAEGKFPMLNEPSNFNSGNPVFGITEQADFITHTVPDAERPYNNRATAAVAELSNLLRGVLSQPEAARKDHADSLSRALQRVKLEIDELLAEPTTVEGAPGSVRVEAVPGEVRTEGNRDSDGRLRSLAPEQGSEGPEGEEVL
jgi:hypothetical protein